jgi:AraC-like DNA-binding protein
MECGFNDSNYFARQFRRILGVSPRQFQNGKGSSAQTV